LHIADEHSSAANCAIEKIDLTLILPPDDSCLEDDEVHDDIIKRLLECDVIIDPPKEFAWNDANQDVANMTAAAESTDDLPHEKNIHTTSDGK
jgi:hypothetical protein